MARKRVYLAGPISGCNERQRREWRDEAKEKLGAGFEVIDPALDPVGPDEDPALVVERDRRAIATCDAVLANMWKESIGTSIGVFHAWSNAKVIVVVDPNHIGSQILRYYADDVTDTIGEAVKSLNRTLRAESALRALQRNGTSEPLYRRKLANSIRRACFRGATSPRRCVRSGRATSPTAATTGRRSSRSRACASTTRRRTCRSPRTRRTRRSGT